MVGPQKEIAHTFMFKILGSVISIIRRVSIAFFFSFFQCETSKKYFPQNNKFHIEKIKWHCWKQKFESQLQIAMLNLVKNPKFTYVTKLIKLNIKKQIK